MSAKILQFNKNPPPRFPREACALERVPNLSYFVWKAWQDIHWHNSHGSAMDTLNGMMLSMIALGKVDLYEELVFLITIACGIKPMGRGVK